MLLSIPMPVSMFVSGVVVVVVVLLLPIFVSGASGMSGMVLLSMFGSVEFIISFMVGSRAVVFMFMFDMLPMSGAGDDDTAAEMTEVATGREAETYS